jgi:hypothetical protein
MKSFLRYTFVGVTKPRPPIIGIIRKPPENNETRHPNMSPPSRYRFITRNPEWPDSE